MRHLYKTGILAAGLLMGLLPTSSQAITNGVAPAEDDFRFDAVGAFSHAHWLGQNPEHSNAQENNWYCTATLVTPSVIVTAGHCTSNPQERPPGFYAVRFRRHLDGSIGTKEAGPDSYYHALVDSWVMPGGDFAVGILAAPVEHIRPIPVLVEGTDRLAAGQPITNAGWGKEGPGFDEGSRNELLLCKNQLTQSSHNALFFRTASQNGCGVNVHDSGSPILVEDSRGALRTLAEVTMINFAPSYHSYVDVEGLPYQHTPFDAPDLLVDVEVVGGTYSPGQKVTVALHPRNVGNSGPRGTAIRAELVGPDGVVQDWTLLESLDQKQGWRKRELQLDARLPAGTYSMRLSADPAHQIDEYFEGNNASETSIDITVTSVSGQLHRILFFPLLDDGGLAGFVTAGERSDGRVAVVAGWLDATDSFVSLDVLPGFFGGFPFTMGGIQFTLHLGDEPSLAVASDLVTATPPFLRSSAGPAGHLQGIYRTQPAPFSTSARALSPSLHSDDLGRVVIVAADGLLIGGSTDGGEFFFGSVDYITESFEDIANGTEGLFIWDDGRRNFFLDVVSDEGSSQLALETS